jgi:Recombination, repair and ssDNA binding protein UvsY
MNIDKILDEWEKDSNIDRTALDEESSKIPKLHHKYYKLYAEEKLILRKLESDLKLLKLDKYEFYSQGPNEDSEKKGWKLPAKGLILKSDIPMYLESDKDIIDLTLKIGYYQEKVNLLESILKSFQNRGYQIRSAIDWIKFTSGS